MTKLNTLNTYTSLNNLASYNLGPWLIVYFKTELSS